MTKLTSSQKKHSLKRKSEDDIFNGSKLFFSGFALTDNKKFAHFGIKNLPKEDMNHIKFNFSKKNLTFSLDKEISPVIQGEKVFFGDLFIEKKYLDYFKKLFTDDLKFFTLNSFLGNRSETEVIIFKKEGKDPVGVFRLEKGGKEN